MSVPSSDVHASYHTRLIPKFTLQCSQKTEERQLAQMQKTRPYGPRLSKTLTGDGDTGTRPEFLLEGESAPSGLVPEEGRRDTLTHRAHHRSYCGTGILRMMERPESVSPQERRAGQQGY